MLSTVLLAGYWPCPRELQRFTFVSPAHCPHYPSTPAVNSSTLTAGFLFVLFCTQIFEKNDCSRRMRKVVFNPPNMQPYPFFSKILLFTFFGEKLFCNFHRRNFWWERLLSWERLRLVRPIFDWNVRENDAMSLHRGELDHCHFFWAKHVLKHGPWEWWVT